MLSFHTDTVIRLRAVPTIDRYGDQVPGDWTTADQLPIAGCRVQPAAGPEVVVDRDEITRRWFLWAPANADVLATDRIRWQGADYEIQGEVRRWPSPTGNLAHIECDLLRVEG